MRRSAPLAALVVASFTAAFLLTKLARRPDRPAVASDPGPRVSATSPETDPPGMAWVPGGEFTIGTDAPAAAPAERPAHRARVSGFWIDVTEVTNAAFRRFVEATGYVTTAERPVDWEQLGKELPPGMPK